MEIKKKILQLEDEMISLRRDFHAHPELGFNEKRTSEIIYKYLKELGLEVERIAKTGIVGLLKGSKPGKTVMLRSDIDAIPVKEENDLPFKSKNEGISHNCGHDGHISMLLIAAKILSGMRDEIKGNIKFAFQPNEEHAGAYLMIEDGVLESPKVDAVFGIHLWSLINSGEIGVVEGPIMASSHYFNLKLTGKGGHAGAPHDSIDPVVCANSIMQSSYTMQAREINVVDPTVISFCKFIAGSSPTIIPQEVEMEGSIRCLHEKFDIVKNKFERITSNISKAHRCEYELDISLGNSLLSNDEKLVDLVKKSASEIVGKENIKSDVQVMLGEDFAEYGKEIPVAFYFVGVANEKKNTDYPHHHPKFNIDEDVLKTGVEMHIMSAINYLNQ